MQIGFLLSVQHPCVTRGSRWPKRRMRRISTRRNATVNWQCSSRLWRWRHTSQRVIYMLEESIAAARGGATYVFSWKKNHWKGNHERKLDPKKPSVYWLALHTQWASKMSPVLVKWLGIMSFLIGKRLKSIMTTTNPLGNALVMTSWSNETPSPFLDRINSITHDGQKDLNSSP